MNSVQVQIAAEPDQQERNSGSQSRLHGRLGSHFLAQRLSADGPPRAGEIEEAQKTQRAIRLFEEQPDSAVGTAGMVPCRPVSSEHLGINELSAFCASARSLAHGCLLPATPPSPLTAAPPSAVKIITGDIAGCYLKPGNITMYCRSRFYGTSRQRNFNNW